MGGHTRTPSGAVGRFRGHGHGHGSTSSTTGAITSSSSHSQCQSQSLTHSQSQLQSQLQSPSQSQVSQSGSGGVPPGGTMREGVVGRRRCCASLCSCPGVDLDSLFFWVLLVYLTTVFTFLSTHHQDAHLLLSVSQQAEFARRVRSVGNASVYVMETTREDHVLFNVSAEEWEDLSYGLDFVALVFDDNGADWVTEDLIRDMRDAGRMAGRNVIHMGVFACGCILPRKYFAVTDVRMQGFECILLPGMVLHERDVVWIQQGFVGNGNGYGNSRQAQQPRQHQQRQDEEEGTEVQTQIRMQECKGKDAIVGSGARGSSLTYSKQLSEIKHALTLYNHNHDDPISVAGVGTRSDRGGGGGPEVRHGRGRRRGDGIAERRQEQRDRDDNTLKDASAVAAH